MKRPDGLLLSLFVIILALVIGLPVDAIDTLVVPLPEETSQKYELTPITTFAHESENWVVFARPGDRSLWMYGPVQGVGTAPEEIYERRLHLPSYLPAPTQNNLTFIVDRRRPQFAVLTYDKLYLVFSEQHITEMTNETAARLDIRQISIQGSRYAHDNSSATSVTFSPSGNEVLVRTWGGRSTNFYVFSRSTSQLYKLPPVSWGTRHETSFFTGRTNYHRVLRGLTASYFTGSEVGIKGWFPEFSDTGMETRDSNQQMSLIMTQESSDWQQVESIPSAIVSNGARPCSNRTFILDFKMEKVRNTTTTEGAWGSSVKTSRETTQLAIWFEQGAPVVGKDSAKRAAAGSQPLETTALGGTARLETYAYMIEGLRNTDEVRIDGVRQEIVNGRVEVQLPSGTHEVAVNGRVKNGTMVAKAYIDGPVKLNIEEQLLLIVQKSPRALFTVE